MNRWTLLLAFTLLTAAYMAWEFFTSPIQPIAPAIDFVVLPPGVNDPPALRVSLTAMAAEMILLVGILRPWSYTSQWWRPVVALVLFAPWTLFLFPVSRHIGPVRATLGNWNIAICLLLLTMAVMDLVRTRRQRTVSPDTP